MEKIIFNNEIAKKTKWDGYYATISGKVISIKVPGGQGKLDYSKPRELCYKIDKDGYLLVTISSKLNGVKKNFYPRVHRIIWETFNGEIINDLTVDHINDKRDDNRLENLQLLTRGDNARKAVKGKKSKMKGKNNFKLRHKFKVYIDGKEVGIYHREEIFKIFNINKWDLEQFLYKNKMSKKLLERKITLEKV